MASHRGGCLEPAVVACAGPCEIQARGRRRTDSGCYRQQQCPQRRGLRRSAGVVETCQDLLGPGQRSMRCAECAQIDNADTDRTRTKPMDPQRGILAPRPVAQRTFGDTYLFGQLT